MSGDRHPLLAPRPALFRAAFLLALGLLPSSSPARQDSPSVEDRLRRLEETNRLLLEQNDTLRQQLDATNRKLDEFARKGADAPPPPPLSLSDPRIPGLTTPVFSPAEEAPPPPFRPAEAPARPEPPRFLIGGRDDELGEYYLARSADPDRLPYELRADVRTQFRYTGFPRAKTTWTNSAGQVLPVRSINIFEINRNWLQFSGFALDPRLQYNLALLSSTASNNTTLLGWVNYRFSDALDLRAGYWLIPGSREWYNSYRYTMGAERLMATTFFRPNISPGVWAQGEPVEGFNYVFMVANAFNRFNQTANRLGTNLTYSGSAWWEPLGDYGVGPSDHEFHETFTPRVGTSFTGAREMSQNPQANPANPEDTILRLTDGTPVFLTDSLGPGTQVDAVSIQLWAIDAAFKYRGFSFAAEYYLRWLDNFRYRTTPAPVDSLFAHGGYAQAGYFLVPGSLELFARHSIVTGDHGTGAEWGGGVNWYVRQTRDWRVTFEVLQISRSPADNILTGYRAGESGTLFQLQMFTDF